MVLRSIWQEDTSIPKRNPLTGDITVHTAIIGGGMAGVLTAYFLRQRGVECVILEADRIGSGQTENTTAKITSQHDLIYDHIVHKIGKEQAVLYAQANEAAVRQYRTLIQAQHIDCDWEECPAYLFTQDQPESLEKEYAAAKSVGIRAELTDQTELPFPVRTALRYDGQAKFHPLKFLKAVSRELTIYEDTIVRAVKGQTIVTDRGNVEAENIVFACHYPFVNVPGYYFMRMHQERSYVLALENAGHVEGMYLSIDKGGLSVRSAGDMILLGGAGHRTGENTAGGQYQYLKDMAKLYWTRATERARWSAQDCVTLDKIPYIGRFGKSTDHWYVATGFRKWGMSSSMVSAMLLSGQITGVKNPQEMVFSPRRATFRASAVQLMKESAHAAAGLLGRADMPKEKKEGLASCRCTHLGCKLSWNPEEETYDCPCHGSRFSSDGTVIDEPAKKPLKMLKEDPADE